MKKKNLYLHVGWSKTGTSAIQAQVQAQHSDFIKNGILYPQTIQWMDCSHHPFALSFMSSGPYSSNISIEATLEKLRTEMIESSADSVLISSELSPIYFENAEFERFAREHFECVKIIFTLRCQSELILSLFNQLIKDDNVQYRSSLFTLAMQNIRWLNYYETIKKWINFVGIKNIIIIPYGGEVVQSFLSLFSVTINNSASAEKKTNPSLPNRCLLAIQTLGINSRTPSEYHEVREKVVALSSSIPKEYDTVVLFSEAEQSAFDKLFHESNILLEKEIGFDSKKIIKQNYSSIMAIPDNLLKEL